MTMMRALEALVLAAVVSVAGCSDDDPPSANAVGAPAPSPTVTTPVGGLTPPTAPADPNPASQQGASASQIASAERIAADDPQVRRYVQLAGTASWSSRTPWYTERADGSWRLQGLALVLDIRSRPLVSDTWRTINYPGIEEGHRTDPWTVPYATASVEHQVDALQAVMVHVDLERQEVVGLVPWVSQGAHTSLPPAAEQ